jgi:FkbM family methyltransferase
MKALLRSAVKAYLRSPFRGKTRLLEAAWRVLSPTGGTEHVRIGDYILALDHTSRATRMMAYGIYEQQELVELSKLVPPGATVFDLGGNVGYCSARFAQMVGSNGRVFSFEPSPTCLENLRKLESSSSSDVISIIPKGVAESSRTTTYYETERTISYGFGRIDLRPSGRHTVTREEQVEVTSIDDFCSENNIDHIDFIKIDVEGAEVPVLHGMRNCFASGKRPLLLIEMTGSTDCRSVNTEIETILSPLGYESFRLRGSLQPVRVEQLEDGFHGNVLWQMATTPPCEGSTGRLHQKWFIKVL